MKRALRSALRIAGWLLSLLAIAFFVRLIALNGLRLPPQGLAKTAVVVVSGGIAYGASVVLLAWLWTRLVEPETAYPRSARESIAASYLTSQFAKYLPGNVFQYLARHALGRQLGISHGALAAAALGEALLLTCAAAILVVAFGMPMLRAVAPWIPEIGPIWVLCPLAVIPVLHYLPRRIALTAWIPRYSFPSLVMLLSGYLVFFLIFGGIFIAMLVWSRAPSALPLRIIGGSSAAWLTGFLVPGAPAGAGLREAVLSLAAGGRASPESLAAIVLFRLATLSGDFFAFLTGWAFARHGTSARMHEGR